MSDLTEREIMDAHATALKEARDAALKLARHADPELIAPRGQIYLDLKDAIGRIEGSARQMAQWREDARWVKCGAFWAKVRPACQKLYLKKAWLQFRTIAQIAERGLVSMDELAESRTGVIGAILPNRASEWLNGLDAGPIARASPPRRFLN